MSTTRVLSVLGDTDATDGHLAALDQHAVLVAAGLEVRTLALGPGGRGGLDERVPVMAPARRSLATRTRFLAELRWADVVLLHAPGALTRAAPPGDVPHLVVYHAVQAGRTVPRWSVEAQLVRSAAAVVVPDPADGATVSLRVGAEVSTVVAPGDDPSRWLALLTGVTTGGSVPDSG